MRRRTLMAVLVSVAAVASACSHSKEGLSRGPAKRPGTQMVPGATGKPPPRQPPPPSPRAPKT